MIHLNNISKSFGGKDIILSFTGTISNKRTIIVGPNGSGKTTLLSILAGSMEPNSGNVIIPPKKIVHSISQHEAYSLPDIPVKEFIENSRQSSIIKDLKKEEEYYLSLMEQNSDEQLFIRLRDIQEKIEEEENLHYTSLSFSEIVEPFGFSTKQLKKNIHSLSGGWRLKLLLATAMIKNPDIMLLDEPTNYLDIESTNFLLTWIKEYKGYLITVSHDYDFLCTVGKETWEINNGIITTYNGDYSFYLKERKIRIKLLKKKREKQERNLKELSSFIEKFRSKATTASRVQSAIKEYNKIKQNIIIVPRITGNISFHFPDPIRGGDISIASEDIYFSYDNKNFIISSFSKTIKRGEKIAIVGKNGVGKTTLIHILAGLLSPNKGSIYRYKNEKLSLYRQHEAESLPEHLTVYDFMYTITPFDKIPQIRSILASFLFFDDSLYTKISALSGGEKVRLALIKVLMNPSTILIFDEPTTHLDIESREILINYLQKYTETIIFVSHDTHFINSVADSIIYFEHNEIVQFPGKLHEYKEKDFNPHTTELSNIKKNFSQKEWIINKKNRQKLQKLQKNIKEIEKNIKNCENKISLLEASMYNGKINQVEGSFTVENLHKNLDKLYLDWENTVLEIEQVEKLFNKE